MRGQFGGMAGGVSTHNGLSQKSVAPHTCSMSRRGNCYDAVMEACFLTVKNAVEERFISHADATAELTDLSEVLYQPAL